MSDGCGFDESLSGPEVGPIPVSDPRHPQTLAYREHLAALREMEAERTEMIRVGFGKLPDPESERAWRVAQLAAVVLGGSYADRGLDLADRELSADVSWSIQMARALLAEAERAEGGGA